MKSEGLINEYDPKNCSILKISDKQWKKIFSVARETLPHWFP